MVVVESPIRSTPLASRVGVVERGVAEAAQPALPPRPRPEMLALVHVTRIADAGIRGHPGNVELGACTSTRQFPFRVTPTRVQLIVTPDEAPTAPASGSVSEKLMAAGETEKTLITVMPRGPDSAARLRAMPSAARTVKPVRRKVGSSRRVEAILMPFSELMLR